MATRDKVLLVGGGIASIPVVAMSVVAIIAVWPMLNLIGIGLTVFVFVCLCCASLGVVSFTIHRIGVWHLNEVHRKNTVDLIVAGDVVAFRDALGGIVHLSAEHEKAKALGGNGLLPDRASSMVGVDGGRDISGNDQTILDLYQKGISADTIAKCVKLPFEVVQRVCRERG